jgi:hypothetical protein
LVADPGETKPGSGSPASLNRWPGWPDPSNVFDVRETNPIRLDGA